jgi:signal transduction histidine kinase/CheY-like chemotaxis protein
MTQFTSLRARLVGTVFVALVPAWVVMYLFAYDPPWVRFSAGIMALGAAWFGGEKFILRQVRSIIRATKLLAGGDLTVRTGLDRETGELGDLARDIDKMAAALQQKAADRETAEQTLMNRALQQTVVSALGQFALASRDLGALMNQATMLVSQTLGIEYTGVFDYRQDNASLVLRSGVGWEPELQIAISKTEGPPTPLAHALETGEPIVIEDFSKETRFAPVALFRDYSARSGAAIPIASQRHPSGLLVVHTTNQRAFTSDEIQFLLAVATVLAMASARDRAELDLEKLAAFAQLNPNPAMELDKNARVTYTNDAARRLATSFGRPHPQELLPPDCQKIIGDCLSSGRPLLNEKLVLDGRTLSCSFHPVGTTEVAHAYMEEITERLNLEAQLRQSQKMESVGQLAAGVAHDFNNMLTIIQGHSGLLLVKPSLPEEFRDGVQAVYFAAERAAALTRQLLMFSRKNVIQTKHLDLADVITTTSNLLKRLLGESIELAIDCKPDLPLVIGDTGMIEQVIMNLAVNARDAMTRGGRLTISAREEAIGADYVGFHPDARQGRFVRISVTDTGSGIDPQTLPRIFEPFFTTKEVGKGTGLGLATVYGILKQHNGWIDVQSQLGKGTTFSVYFPALGRKPGPKPAPEQSAPDPLKPGKETILVVEDEFVLRELAKSILVDCGYRVMDAGSGPEAVKIWLKEKDLIDLVLTDMVMPEGMSGMDLANQFRASKPGIKIVFASGYSMDDLDPAFLRQGSAGFLQKPYTHVSLSKAIRDCLDEVPAENGA